MRQAKKAGQGPADRDADVWASPEFQTLSGGLTEILGIPKERVAAILADEKAAKIHEQNEATK